MTSDVIDPIMQDHREVQEHGGAATEEELHTQARTVGMSGASQMSQEEFEKQLKGW